MQKRPRNNPELLCPACDHPCCTRQECRSACACCECRRFHQQVEPTLRTWQWITDTPDSEMAWEAFADATVPVSPQTEREWKDLIGRIGDQLGALKALSFPGGRKRGRPPQVPRAELAGTVRWIDHIRSLRASGADVLAHVNQEPHVTNGPLLIEVARAVVRLLEEVPTRGSRLVAAVMIHALTGRHVLRRGRQRAVVLRLQRRRTTKRTPMGENSVNLYEVIIPVHPLVPAGRPRKATDR